MRAVLACCVLSAHLSCVGACVDVERSVPPQQVGAISGPLRYAVDRAKQAGVSEAGLGSSDEDLPVRDLAGNLRPFGVLILRATAPGALVVAQGDGIATVSVFAKVEVLKAVPSLPDCLDITLSFPIKDGESAIALTGGSILIEGVRVSHQVPHPPAPFTVGKTYLAVVSACNAVMLRAELGPWSFVEVGTSGELMPVASPEAAPAAYGELLRLGTLAQVRALIAALR